MEDSCCGSSSLLCDMVWSSHSFILRRLPSHLCCGYSSVLLDSCKCPEVVPVWGGMYRWPLTVVGCWNPPLLVADPWVVYRSCDSVSAVPAAWWFLVGLVGAEATFSWHRGFPASARPFIVVVLAGSSSCRLGSLFASSWSSVSRFPDSAYVVALLWLRGTLVGWMVILA